MTQAIAVEDLGVRFGGAPVFENLSLDVSPGEFVVLLGPSGCGKSTLLNAIAGLLDVDAGTVRIGDRDVTWDEPSTRGIGMVFQSYALYPTMSVRGNLAFGARLAGMARPEVARRIDEIARLLQIEPLLDRRPSALSGGQRQRVAIGRALMRDASVFLFDEPLSNLDAQLRASLRREIKELHARLGATMIYVTHDQIEALTLATRIVVMRGGRIEQIGPPAEVYARPTSLFVARFVGSPAINLVDARPGPDGRLHALGRALPWRADRPAVLGVRPEDLSLAPAGAGPAARVALVEPMGADTLVWCEIGGETVGVRGPATGAPGVGDAVAIGMEMDRACLFDAETEKRIEGVPA